LRRCLICSEPLNKVSTLILKLLFLPLCSVLGVDASSEGAFADRERKALLWGSLFMVIAGIIAIAVPLYLLTRAAPQYLYVVFGPIAGSALALLVNGAYGLVKYWASVLRLIIEVPREDAVRKPIFATLNPPLLCTCPTQQTQQQAPIQEIGYLRLRVRNLGPGTADDCVFKVRIARWPSNCSVNCHVPSDEYVDWQDVLWAGWVESVTIRPNDVRYVNIIMMPLQGGKACIHAQWHCANQCGPIIAWVAKRDVFMLGCTARLQDGLVSGEYRIDAQVTCRNGQTRESMKLIISQDWNATDITTA